MKTLANGKSQKTILKILLILIETSQSNFGDLDLDDDCIRDIADVITANDSPASEQSTSNNGAAAQNSPDRTGIQQYQSKGAIICSTA